ncbi:MAG: hypothetical protein GF417_06665 [Candidatus Latescibacteria bacterium]|nr:hypothetical protein [bacterium]MBD3424100.1 hypothetical protein [Candidatus Latescibacterota bacterium]
MKKTLLILAAATVLSAPFTGCEEEDSVTSPVESGIDWPDRTEAEDCVAIMEMVFRHGNIDKYRDLLLRPDTSGVFPQGYIWFNQVEDITGGEVEDLYLNCDQDIAATDSILSNSDSLYLDIFTADWDSLEIFRGKPCSDCWKTIRSYHLFWRMDSGRNYFCYFYLKLIIGPDPDEDNKYQIYEAFDLQEPFVSGRCKLPENSEYTSLGELKDYFLR